MLNGKNKLLVLSLLCLLCLPECNNLRPSDLISTVYQLYTKPNYSVILPRFYLGNAQTAYNRSVLQRLGITHILTIDSVQIPKATLKNTSIKNLYIRAYDSVDTNILPYFPVSNSFIREGIKEGSVLVHCHFGVSRSATLVAAYLMEKNGWSRHEAISYIRTRRRIINPNDGFMEQLRLYEYSNYKVPVCQRMRASMTVKALNFKYKMASAAAAVLVGLLIPISIYLMFDPEILCNFLFGCEEL